ncbi:MAG: long-chain fatty acid--CoA ligase [Deltaproteobacteria bacterium]|nr:long-chain fatty acid--CoA ligase [Deltaproteobacteria bacterium]
MNVIEIIDANAARHPDKTALCTMDKKVTFREVKEKSEQAAACFKASGIKKGDSVAIMSQNSFDFVFSFFGILKAGGVAVPVNHKLTAAEVDYILENSHAALFLFDGSLAKVACSLDVDIQKMALDTRVKNIGFLGDAMDKAPDFTPVPIQDEDLAEILYTSGTTGSPKGCVHTHKSVVSAGITGSKLAGLDENDIMLIAMPIWHSSPLNNWFMGTTYVAGTCVLLREYHPLHFLEAIEKKSCTAYFGAPISYLLPLKVIPHFSEFNLSSMKAWIYGGGPIAPETVKKLVKSYKSDRFYQVYGMTESGPTGIVLSPEDHGEHAGSIGKKALPGARMKVMKNQTTPAGPGETGEIWLKAESMMKGYLDNPLATREAFYDGWYRTCDMARIDENGFLFIVDRIKDMIITGGENVYSKEVEDRIMEYPGVDEAAVIGLAQKDWGETVNAVIVPGKDADLTEDGLTQFLSGRLAKYKIPRKFHFVEKLPHTPSGKVMKYKLREEFSNV